MKLARTIRLDESDDNVFDHPANAGEWAISGGFLFSHWGGEKFNWKTKQTRF